MRYIKLFFLFLKLDFISSVMYRGAFWINSFAIVVSYTTEYIVLWLTVSRFGSVGGWLPEEILLLFALDLLCYSFAGVFCNKTFGNFPELIRRGQLDEVLTKPFSPLALILMRGVNTGYVNQVFVATVVLIYAIVRLHIYVSISSILMLVLFIVSGGLLMTGIYIMLSLPAIWWLNTDLLFLLFNIRGFMKYPISIYPGFIQIILTFVLPFAFINFYPAAAILGKNGVLLSNGLSLLIPIVGVVIFGLAWLLFGHALKSYTSTGS